VDSRQLDNYRASDINEEHLEITPIRPFHERMDPSTLHVMGFSHVDRRRAHRPKPAELAGNPRLFQIVEEKLVLWWPPSPISRWLMETCPDDEELRVSHNTMRAPPETTAHMALFCCIRGWFREGLNRLHPVCF
jgi:hypothetical protein